jgi:hypothetical protein
MPLSEKRKKHLERKARKKGLSRTREERLEKIDEVYDNFQRTGFPPTPEIKKFFQICKKWVDDGQLTQGIIPIPSLNIEICYTLNNSKLHDVGVMIRHTGQGPPPALGRPQETVPVTVKDVTKETVEPVVEEITEQAVEETTEQVIEETTEQAVEETTEQVVEETTEQAVEETTEQVIEERTETILELNEIDDDDDEDDDEDEDDTIPELVSTTETSKTLETSEEKQEETIFSKLTSMINPLNWTSNSK